MKKPRAARLRSMRTIERTIPGTGEPVVIEETVFTAGTGVGMRISVDLPGLDAVTQLPGPVPAGRRGRR